LIPTDAAIVLKELQKYFSKISRPPSPAST
jgi:hypothetical protein